MKPGYIVFSADRKGFIENSIKFFRNFEFNHCFIYCDKLCNIDEIIIEASRFGVRFDSWTLSYLNNPEIKLEVWDIGIPEDKANEMLRDLKKYLHVSYAFLNLVGFIWVWFLAKFGIISHNPFKKGIQCSMLLYYALEYLNLLGPLAATEPADTAPDLVYKAVQLIPNAKKIAIKDFDKTELTYRNNL